MRNAALVLTLLGALLSFGAIAWASVSSLRTRRRLRTDIDWARASNLQMVDACNLVQSDLPRQMALRQPWDDRFEERLGHRADGRLMVDDLLAVERMQLMMADDQIRDLRGPVLLVTSGIVVSTIGSVLSLWA